MHQRSADAGEGNPHNGSTSTAHLVDALRAHNQLLAARHMEDRAMICDYAATIVRLRRRNHRLHQLLLAAATGDR